MMWDEEQAYKNAAIQIQNCRPLRAIAQVSASRESAPKRLGNRGLSSESLNRQSARGNPSPSPTLLSLRVAEISLSPYQPGNLIPDPGELKFHIPQPCPFLNAQVLKKKKNQFLFLNTKFWFCFVFHPNIKINVNSLGTDKLRGKEPSLGRAQRRECKWASRILFSNGSWQAHRRVLRSRSIEATWMPRKNFGAGHVKVKVAQSCPTLCDPMEFSIPEFWSG